MTDELPFELAIQGADITKLTGIPRTNRLEDPRVFNDVDDGHPGPGPESPGDPPDLQFFYDSVFLEGNAGGCNTISEIVAGVPSEVLLDDGFESGP